MRNHIIAIGASTGGTKALEMLLTRLPAGMPGMVIVQHMPPVFTKKFAERLDKLGKTDVSEASDGEKVTAGMVRIAAGNYHLMIEKRGSDYYTRIRQTPPVHHHRPSVDVLFDSVAETAGADAMGILLTGMGSDGARGLLKMRDYGACTIAQDEATSLLFGMPKEAIKINAVDTVLPLQEIRSAMISYFEENRTSGRPQRISDRLKRDSFRERE